MKINGFTLNVYDDDDDGMDDDEDHDYHDGVQLDYDTSMRKRVFAKKHRLLNLKSGRWSVQLRVCFALAVSDRSQI